VTYHYDLITNNEILLSAAWSALRTYSHVVCSHACSYNRTRLQMHPKDGSGSGRI